MSSYCGITYLSNPLTLKGLIKKKHTIRVYEYQSSTSIHPVDIKNQTQIVLVDICYQTSTRYSSDGL